MEARYLIRQKYFEDRPVSFFAPDKDGAPRIFHQAFYRIQTDAAPRYFAHPFGSRKPGLKDQAD